MQLQWVGYNNDVAALQDDHYTEVLLYSYIFCTRSSSVTNLLLLLVVWRHAEAPVADRVDSQRIVLGNLALSQSASVFPALT